jgi:hypothetical protein
MTVHCVKLGQSCFIRRPLQRIIRQHPIIRRQ